MAMRKSSFTSIFILLSFFVFNASVQTNELHFYREDIGMYFQFDKGMKKEKISFKENWDFFVSLKNDSVAIIQDIRNKKELEPKEYRIASRLDSIYVKRYLNGKHYKTEVMYFRRVFL